MSETSARSSAGASCNIDALWRSVIGYALYSSRVNLLVIRIFQGTAVDITPWRQGP